MVLFASLLSHSDSKHINTPSYFRPISDKRGKMSMDGIPKKIFVKDKMR